MTTYNQYVKSVIFFNTRKTLTIVLYINKIQKLLKYEKIFVN